MMSMIRFYLPSVVSDINMMNILVDIKMLTKSLGIGNIMSIWYIQGPSVSLISLYITRKIIK